MDASPTLTPALARELQSFQTRFHSIMGIYCYWQPLDAPPVHWSGSNLCRLMQAQDSGRGFCRKVQDDARRQARRCGGCTVTCPLGLTESAVRVEHNEIVFGYLLTGQVSVSRMIASRESRMVHIMSGQLGDEAKAKALLPELRAMPILPWRRYQEAIELVKMFADSFGTTLYNAQEQKAPEGADSMRRAIEFMKNNLHDPIDVGQIARAAGLSRHHFSRVFREVTGKPPNRYLAELRIERAREMITNDQVRISDVAYSVGFQSLSQFNRTFRALSGQSPTDYRSAVKPSSATGRRAKAA